MASARPRCGSASTCCRLLPGSCWPGRSRAFCRFGARPFATAGMVAAAVSFLLLDLLPVDFAYWQFALVMLLNGIGMGLFASPDRAGVMNSLPPGQRGRRSRDGAKIPELRHGAVRRDLLHADHRGAGGVASCSSAARADRARVPGTAAARVASLPPVSVRFASLLGYNPVRTLLGPVPGHLPPAQAAFLTSRGFFPTLISPAFAQGRSACPARPPRPARPGLRSGAGHRGIHPDRAMAAHPVGAETRSRVLQSGGDHHQSGHSRNIRRVRRCAVSK
jgi:hypothetical protein